MTTHLVLCAALLAASGCQTGLARQTSAVPAGDIAPLSDEFDKPDSLANWKRVDKTEGWNADQLAKFSSENGWLTMVPHTSTWYQDYRGVLVYKDVPGDFVVTTRLRATGRDGQSAPRSMYSLGGLMVRTPRPDTRATFQPGRENYVFLSLGTADQPGRFQFEVKTTQNSQSDLEKILAPSSDAWLQIAKVGRSIILLRNEGEGWLVHKRYDRPDMPPTLQVGLTVYTDYPSASRVSAFDHNSTVVRSGNPDLIAKFDYVRFRRPAVPAGLNVSRASDSELLRFLGAAATK